MSASDSTNKNQFRWVEETTTRRTPGEEGRSAWSQGSTSLTRMHQDPDYRFPDEPGWAHADSKIAVEWSDRAPREWTEPEAHAASMGVGPAFPHAREHPSQGMLFEPGYHNPPKVTYMQGTHRSRFATMAGLGTAAGIAQQVTGEVPVPDTDLSMHSAPLVERMTGRRQEISNTMDFPSGETVGTYKEPMPDQPEFTSDTNIDGTWTRRHRFIPDSEIKQGRRNITSYMREQRGPQLDTKSQQGQLFQPEGRGYPEYRKHLENEAHNDRVRARYTRRTGRPALF